MEDYKVRAAVYLEKNGERDLIPLRGQHAKSELWYIPVGELRRLAVSFGMAESQARSTTKAWLIRSILEDPQVELTVHYNPGED